VSFSVAGSWKGHASPRFVAVVTQQAWYHPRPVSGPPLGLVYSASAQYFLRLAKIILSSILTAQARGNLTARRNVARLAVPATPRPGGSLNQTFVLGALRVATQHHRLH
jgi:hypothetical protein